MLNGKKVVLVVDDDLSYCDGVWERLTRNGNVVITSLDLQQVWDKVWAAVGKATAIDLVILDGEVSSLYYREGGARFSANGEKLPCTLEFIRDLRREGYTGPILANSGSIPHNEAMRAAGASHTMPQDRGPTSFAEQVLAGEV